MSTLHLRILSAVVLLPIVSGFIYFGGIAYTVFLSILGVLGLYEWQNLAKANLDILSKGIAVVGIVMAVPASGALGVPAALALLLSFSVALILLLPTLKKDIRSSLLFTAGFFYVGLGAVLLNVLRNISDRFWVDGLDGLWPTILILLMVWTTDTAAYFSGKKFGKRKLAPAISPNKTWEGLIGGAIATTIISMIFFFAAGLSQHIAWWALLLIAPVMTVVSQIGDLSISFLKRQKNLKDTGKLIPGHGGLLDRIDGLLLALPVFYLWFLAVL